MKKILLAALSLFALTMQAKVAMPELYSDNMVLKQNSDVSLHGTASPNSQVTITPSWQSAPVRAQADKSGHWAATLTTPAGSFDKYTLTITDGSDPLTINNLRVGEVWLASGQSNMEMPLKGFPGCCIKGGYEEVAGSGAYADKVSFFNVPLTQSYEPVDTVEAVWTVPSPDTAPDYSALAWYYAKRMADVLGVPVGIVSAAHGGARVESWLPRDILETYPDVSLDAKDIEAMTHYLRPMVMYNAMFNPIKDYDYSGIIWYQGCSNVGAHQTYAPRLARMVERWRKEIGRGDIPFYAVEIAPYDYDGTQDNMAPLLREAQWRAIEMIPNADMICINDLVEPFERHNIHPGNKKDAGNRLCDLALNKTYGKKQFPAGSPRYKSHRVQDGAVWVSIDSPNGGICRNYDIRGFEVAGADKVYHPADSVWLHWQTNEIVASSKAVPEPVAVRYCWADFMPGTLYGGNYLPLIPFRTEEIGNKK